MSQLKLGHAERGQAGGNGAHHLAAADQLEFALAHLLDAPAVAVGFFALGHLAGKVEPGRLTVSCRHVLEDELAHGTRQFAVFAFAILQLQPEQFQFVFECCRALRTAFMGFLHAA